MGGIASGNITLPSYQANAAKLPFKLLWIEAIIYFPFVLANQKRNLYDADMDEGRKRVIGIMAAIFVSRNVQSADDLFGGPQEAREQTS